MEAINITDLEKLSRTQFKIVVLALLGTGLVVGIRELAYRYVCKKKRIRTVPKTRKIFKRILKIRGGDTLVNLFELMANYIAEHGSFENFFGTWGIISSLSLVIQFLRLKPIVQWYILYKSVPGNLVKNWPLYKSENCSKFVSYCKDYRFQFLVQILTTEHLEKDERIRLFRTALEDLNFKDVVTITCFIAMLLFLYDSHIGIFYKIIDELIRLLKSGKISKKVARLLIRKLRRYGIYVDPTLVDMAEG